MAAATTNLPAGVSPVPPQPSPHAPPPPPPAGNAKSWRVPRLLLKVRDVSHEGAIRYFETTKTHQLLTTAVIGVLSTLYTHETAPSTQRSVTLILRRMDGVAYTTGSDLDNDHKQIHISLEYLSKIPEARIKEEIEGVVRHEMVHCWQYDGKGTAPGGLIEGIADWVRLKAGFCPPHWKRGGEKWDDGYQNTGYFLDYLCDRFGPNTVKHINLALKDKQYTPDLWLAISGGIPVEALWEQYCKAFNLPPPKRPGGPGGGAKDSEYLVIASDEIAKVQETAKTLVVQQPLPSSTTSAVSTSAASTAAAATSGSSVSVAAPPGSSASSDVWPFSGDTPLAHVMVDRLKHMTFDGTSDATRYILEFEALIDRLQPEMTDEDKKLLLCTSFEGATVVNWYETTCRAVTYAQLKEELQEVFKNY